jgi:hypothetical protein
VGVTVNYIKNHGMKRRAENNRQAMKKKANLPLLSIFFVRKIFRWQLNKKSFFSHTKKSSELCEYIEEKSNLYNER